MRRRAKKALVTLRLVRGIAPAGLVALLVVACNGDAEPDAYGTFEAVDVVVSAETAGRLIRYDPDEGSRFEAGAVVGVVDTTQMALQRPELEAERAGADARARQATAEAAAIEAELETARIELGRTQRLAARDAATPRQLDEAGTRVRTLEERLAAARHQASGANDQVRAVEAKVAQLEDRLDRSRIRSPVGGTVLTSFVEAGEFVQPGQPLFRIAALDTLTLRAWVSETSLSSVRLGDEVTVNVDAPEGRRAFRGTVTWVADEAEFTPTPIQTREERTDLVYAVKIRVPNPDGVLKIGMPADVEFRARSSP